MTSGFTNNLWNGKKTLTPGLEIEQSFKDGKMYETHKMNNQVVRISVFEYFNGDNKFSSDEITQVEQYTYRKDGTLESKVTYFDKNHDGYSDNDYIIDKYNENGDFEKIIFKKDRDIEELKKQDENGTCNDPTLLLNRRMVGHKDGFDKFISY